MHDAPPYALPPSRLTPSVSPGAPDLRFDHGLNRSSLIMFDLGIGAGSSRAVSSNSQKQAQRQSFIPSTPFCSTDTHLMESTAKRCRVRSTDRSPKVRGVRSPGRLAPPGGLCLQAISRFGVDSASEIDAVVWPGEPRICGQIWIVWTSPLAQCSLRSLTSSVPASRRPPLVSWTTWVSGLPVDATFLIGMNLLPLECA